MAKTETSEPTPKATRDKLYRLRKKLTAGTITQEERDWLLANSERTRKEIMARADLRAAEDLLDASEPTESSPSGALDRAEAGRFDPCCYANVVTPYHSEDCHNYKASEAEDYSGTEPFPEDIPGTPEAEVAERDLEEAIRSEAGPPLFLERRMERCMVIPAGVGEVEPTEVSPAAVVELAERVGVRMGDMDPVASQLEYIKTSKYYKQLGVSVDDSEPTDPETGNPAPGEYPESSDVAEAARRARVLGPELEAVETVRGRVDTSLPHETLHAPRTGLDCSGETGPIVDPEDIGAVNCPECIKAETPTERGQRIHASVEMALRERFHNRPLYSHEMTKAMVEVIIRDTVRDLPEGSVEVRVKVPEDGSLPTVEGVSVASDNPEAASRYIVGVKQGEKVRVVLHNGKGLYRPGKLSECGDGKWAIFITRKMDKASEVRRYIRMRTTGRVEVLTSDVLAGVMELEKADMESADKTT